MPDRSSPGTPSIPEIQARLAELTQRLRDSATLDPESRGGPGQAGRRAEHPLADDPGAARRGGRAGPHHHPPGGLCCTPTPSRECSGKVRDQFEQAVLDAEAHAPVAVGLARRLMETLANLGI